MPDMFDAEKRSEIMRRVRGKHTTPELRVRRRLHRAGFRFRLHVKTLPGTPDIVLPRFRTAVFVHGCFWHWHGCRRSRMPATNRAFWQAKIDRNVARDKKHQLALAAAGWRCRVIWECEAVAATEALLVELDAERIAMPTQRRAA